MNGKEVEGIPIEVALAKPQSDNKKKPKFSGPMRGMMGKRGGRGDFGMWGGGQMRGGRGGRGGAFPAAAPYGGYGYDPYAAAGYPAAYGYPGYDMYGYAAADPYGGYGGYGAPPAGAGGVSFNFFGCGRSDHRKIFGKRIIFFGKNLNSTS